MPKGFDANFDCSQLIAKAKSAGVGFIGRYYSHTASKNLSPSEAKLISANGIQLVAVWETLGNHYNFFSVHQGIDDGTSAANQALKIGQPTDSAIYFAVDFDANGQQVSANIAAYFQGVKKGISAIISDGPSYSIGAYGSGLVCSTLIEKNLAQYAWLSCSTGWSESKDYTEWHIKQSVPSDPWGFGHDIDPDEAEDAYGGFTVATGQLVT